ncbi:hypothetical protein [Desulfuromonas acetoxidans]|uniref:hypothetical protein n=1 Tax=Desulfuromonas acetoxidans TaxID=891 RepID=UPI002930312A|nr:hypothetical protein [Desulfuromonas acetoxidans]
MSKVKFYYQDGLELQKNDTVLVNDKQIARVEKIFDPGTGDAANYFCEKGGFILAFENSDVQVWGDTDEDISLVRRN